MITTVLINGEPSDGRIDVTDSSVLRGDGCFEVIRVYRGVSFRLEDHLRRLERSASLLDLPVPARGLLRAWVEDTASRVFDGAVRIVVTRGPSLPGSTVDPRVIVFGHPWAGPDKPARLYPLAAPWHAAGEDWDLAGAKLISYAANMAATRTAQKAGYDDALLHTVDGLILEGTTFSVGWVVGGVIETPGLDLGILDSITRRVVFEIAADIEVPIVETTARLERLDDADEVLVFSTIREVQAVAAVGERVWEPGPLTERLRGVFRRLAGEPDAAAVTLGPT